MSVVTVISLRSWPSALRTAYRYVSNTAVAVVADVRSILYYNSDSFYVRKLILYWGVVVGNLAAHGIGNVQETL